MGQIIMEFQLVINKSDNIYKCFISQDNEICIIETSFNKERAVRKALDRLYVKLRCQGIDPNSVTLKRINGDEK